jgi:hypothetical protein
MLRLIVLLGAFVATTAIPVDTQAGCVWKWDCSSGTCQQIPVCDSTLDIAPPRPPQVAPIPAPTIRPIQRPTVPPVGTRLCTQRYICSGLSCSWQTICR